MIIVDVETTGIDPEKHSIVSIGAVDFSNPSNEFYMKIPLFYYHNHDQKFYTLDFL